MKNKIQSLVLILLMYLPALGQNDSLIALSKVKVIVGGSSSLVPMFVNARFMYANGFLGVSLPVKKGRFSICGTYKFQGNITYRSSELGQKYLGDMPNPAFLQRVHFIGVESYYTVFEDKIISPLLGLSILTQISSNYKNGLLSSINLPTLNYNYYPPSGMNDSHSYYESYFYQQTPFMLDAMLGVSFKVFKGFRIDFSLVNTIQLIQRKHLVWDNDDWRTPEIEAAIKDVPLKNSWKENFGLRLTFKYCF